MKQRGGRAKKKNRTVSGSWKVQLGYYLMMCLPVLVLILFNYVPMAGIYMAFVDFKPAKGIFGSDWVGLKWFLQFFGSMDFIRIFRNTILYNLVSILLVKIGCGVLFALLLYEIRSRLANKIFQTAMLLPNFLSWTVISACLYMFLAGGTGFFNQFLEAVGISAPFWYGEPKYWPFIIPITMAYKEVERAAAADYETLKRESVRSHARLYNRSQISIDGNCRRGISTKERLQEGEEDNALYTLLFNYGKYLMISGSRPGTQALNLQGIWNDKLMAPWSSNYTLNINTEMNYWPALIWGLPECYEPLIRMTRELAQSGRETAKIYYGAGGWICHHSSDLWRLTHPGTNRLPGNAQWGFWNMASGWLSVMLWKYYRYTLDARYLREIFPIMEGAAGFYRELLVECGGELILPLATSPENNYIRDGEVHALDRSAAMSQEILADLFSAVGRAQEILGRTNAYGDLARKLRRPLIGSSGELCEWHEEHGVWDVHHRHLSHLYGLFPANLFREEEKKAAKKALESRGDGGTGWSLAWKVNLWARLGEGEHALSLLKRQLRPVSAGEEGHEQGGGSYPNLFCAHPPFQIDGNFGAANGIMEMLLQCDGEGNPILLPALPGVWRKGSVRDLYLPGRRRISFAWEDGRVLWSKIVPAGPKGQEAGAAWREGGKAGDEQISDIQL